MDKIFDKHASILLVGFGSIGKRHYKNLLGLGYKNIAIFDPVNKSFVGFEGVRRLKKFNQKTASDFDIAFICSPNNMHIRHALVCAEAELHLFIEKPLSHSLRNLRTLESVCRKNELITMVGCNMRFHPCLEFIKNFLGHGKLGRIYGVRHEFGYYLPYWRPAQDYRKNYAAKRSTGGGIILDDIHEFDLLFWLNDFNKVIGSKIFFNNSGALAIQTEDQAAGIFLFDNKVLGTVICDYLQKYYSRKCKVVGERGALEWNWQDESVVLKTKDKISTIFQAKNFDFNQVYIKEVKYFFKCIKERSDTFNDIKRAGGLLEHCLTK